MNARALLAAAAVVAVTGCSGGGHPAGIPATGPPTSPATSPSTAARPTAVTGAPRTVTTASTAARPACSTPAVIAGWPLARKAALLVVVPVLGGDAAVVSGAAARRVGGLLLLGAAPPAARLEADLAPLRAVPSPAPVVMVDQEGGGVQRLGDDVTPLPWPRQMAEQYTPAQVRGLAAVLGGQMSRLGVRVDLAPVLDVDGGPALTASDPDGPRSFSADPAVAATYGVAFASGLRDGGAIPVAKHFPGLGGSTGNTDYGPASTRPLGALEAGGLVPFERAVAAGVPAVMVANASVPGLSALPASLSPAVIDGLLRRQLGFRGLVLTDSLSAGAVSHAGFDVPAAAVAAVGAGADMVLFGSTLTAADTARLAPGPDMAETDSIVSAIVAAVHRGHLAESRVDDAVAHVLRAEGVDPCG